MGKSLNELNKQFEDYTSQINCKLKEAATALHEVNRLRKEANLDTLIVSRYYHEQTDDDLLEELQEKLDLIDVSDLEKELNEAGWSTSSSYC